MTNTRFEEYLSQVKDISNSDMDRREKIQNVTDCKEKLLKDQDMLMDLLEKSARMEEPEAFLPQDINGFSLYRDPDKDFSIHVFVWAPHVPYPIHDHGSWGIVGLYRGKIEETKWQWLGEDQGLVELERQQPKSYTAGQVFHVLPLEEGPHSMRTLGDQTAISIHTYGRPVRKSMLRLFHPSFDQKGKFSYYYAYPLYVYRRMLALNALGAVNEGAGEELEEELIRTSSNKVLLAALRQREINN